MISRSEIAYLTDRADRPEPEHVAGDFFRFAIDWQCDGRTYTTHIWARDAADAERRLQALRSSAVVVGQIKAERDCA
jgi:hypothetical protein